MSGLSISPTEKTQELLSAAKDKALENAHTQVSAAACKRVYVYMYMGLP